uniref:Uncharacterized protein n=1 Tax=Tetradesmus obliquus TaxID=3088 RepID=A0A383VSU1_TETOB|eukprot:jgi/Sobl393_1/14925/SZX68585.1
MNRRRGKGREHYFIIPLADIPVIPGKNKVVSNQPSSQPAKTRSTPNIVRNKDSGLYHRRDEYSWQESLLPKECVLAAAQLTELTHLALEGTIGRKGLLQVVQQLTGLRHLSLWWDWMSQYFDNDGYEQGDYTQEERQQAAGDVLTVMRAIDEGLPRLQHLDWLCDTIRTKSADERMSLDRIALQHVLQELEDEAPDCVQMQQLYYAGKIWLNKE